MAGPYTWNNVGEDRDGTASTNWTPNTPVGGPEAGSDIIFSGSEAGAVDALDGSALPTSGPNVLLNYITINGAYTLSAGAAKTLADFTAGGAFTYNIFEIKEVTLQTPNGATIPTGKTLRGNGALSVLDTEVPVATAGACYIDWDTGNLDIFGGIAAAHTITHQNVAAGNLLTCDITGNLNLGAVTDTGIAIDIQPADGATTVTATADIYCGDFTMTAGTLLKNGQDIYVSGDLLYTAGTCEYLDVIHSGTNNATWNQTGANRFQSYTVAAGSTITLLARLASEAIVVETGETIVDGGNDVLITSPDFNDFCDIQGEITGTGRLIASIASARTNSGRISAPSFVLLATTDKLTQSGPVEVSATLIKGSAGTDTGELEFTGTGALGAVSLGEAAAVDRSGILTLGSNAVSITSVTAGVGPNTTNAIALGSCTLQLSSTFEGTDITCTNTTGVIVGGTVQNAVFDNNVNHFVVAAVDCGNTNVTEIIGTPGTWSPNSRSMQVRNYDSSLQIRSW